MSQNHLWCAKLEYAKLYGLLLYFIFFIFLCLAAPGMKKSGMDIVQNFCFLYLKLL